MKTAALVRHGWAAISAAFLTISGTSAQAQNPAPATTLGSISATSASDSSDWTEVALEVPEPAREFRGVWVASVYNLDWPSRPGLSKEAQQAELRSLLDTAATLGLNAVLLQIRPGGDALYDSKLEPWSAVLTGNPGQSPGYDPLAFSVAEAHLRGLELHAWMNPFRAMVGRTGATHWSQLYPDWVRGEKNHFFMDPGLPAVRTHVLAVVRDVVSRYDIDGIHIDDYFYPYPTFGPGAVRLEVPLGDEAQWLAEGRGLSLADWRRNNINLFVRDFYTLTKSLKPAVRVGISPFGIWQPGVPEGIEARVNAYDHLYGDSRRWLQEGWCDYLAPQLYWPITPPKQSFTTLLTWWTAQSKGRPVWPGMAIDRMVSLKEPLLPETELTDQLAVLRRIAPVPGSVMWRMKFLTSDARGISTLLREKAYAERALPPAAPWLGAATPAKPVGRISGTGPETTLTWSAATGAEAPRWWAVQTRWEGKWRVEPLRRTDRNVLPLKALLGSGKSVPGRSQPKSELEAVAVRALSATGMAGPPLVWERPISRGTK